MCVLGVVLYGEKKEITSGENAYGLKICAIIQLILCIIGAIYVLITYSENIYYGIGIPISLGIVFGGFTLYFLLRTIVDIYAEIVNR